MLAHDLAAQFRFCKRLAEEALARVDDAALFAHLPPDNPLAVLVQHIAGNLHSRFTDFWTTDGEKPSRQRAAEFILPETQNRAALLAHWEAGWGLLFALLDTCSDADLNRNVLLRGSALTAREAFLRALTHYAYHAGQIVQQARRVAGPRWETLW